MKTLVKHILPQTGLFTIVFILISAFYNITQNSLLKPLFIKLLLIISIAFVLSCLEYYLYNRKYFRHYNTLLFTSVISWYIGIGGVMILTGWMGYSLSHLIVYTIEFALIYCIFMLYNTYRLKKDAEEINDALAKDLIKRADAPIRTGGSERSVINVDTLSEYFYPGERVDINSLKRRGLVPRSVSYIKVLARGRVDKPLSVYANEFTPAAVKMIVLSGGEAIRAHTVREKDE